MNFEKTIEAFKKWIERLEEKDKEWEKEDWTNWAIDMTDAVIDMYHYFKSLAVLSVGLKEILYDEPKDEDEKKDEKVDNSKDLFI